MNTNSELPLNSAWEMPTPSLHRADRSKFWGTTWQIFFLGVVCLNLFLNLPIIWTWIQGTLLVDDVVMLTHAARVLCEKGSLADFGQFIPVQALREGFTTQPFWYLYLGPVLYLYPFFKILGSSDTVYWFSQTVLVSGLWLCIKNKLGSWKLTALFFALVNLFGTLKGSLFISPTQLPALLVVLTLWGSWEKNHSLATGIWHGVLCGIGLQFRPEISFLVLIYLTAPLFLKERINLRSSGIFLLSVGFSWMGFVLIRQLLGAAGSQDHSYYNIASGIFGKAMTVSGADAQHHFSELLTNRTFQRNLFVKLEGALLGILPPSSGYLLWRRDIFLIWCLGILTFFKQVPLGRTLIIFSFLIFQILLGALTIPEQIRYYDYVFFMAFFEIFLAAILFSSTKSTEKHSPLRLASYALFVLATFYSLRGSQNNRVQHLQAKEASLLPSQIVPLNAFTITNSLVLWQWYGKGSQTCLTQNTPTNGLTRLLKKFPASYLVYFKEGAPLGLDDEVNTYLQTQEIPKIPSPELQNFLSTIKNRPTLINTKTLAILGPQ